MWGGLNVGRFYSYLIKEKLCEVFDSINTYQRTYKRKTKTNTPKKTLQNTTKEYSTVDRAISPFIRGFAFKPKVWKNPW